jgi:hypothetical protein
VNRQNIAAAPVAATPRERDGPAGRPNETWKPYPCLLTRKELEAIVAEQLG